MLLLPNTTSPMKPLWKCTPRITPSLPRASHIKFDQDNSDTECPSSTSSLTTPTDDSNVYNGPETYSDEVKMYENCLREMWGEEEAEESGGWLSSVAMDCHEEDEKEDSQEPSEMGVSDPGDETGCELDEDEEEMVAVKMRDTRLVRSHHRFDFPSPEEEDSDIEYECDDEDEEMQDEQQDEEVEVLLPSAQDTNLMAHSGFSHHHHRHQDSDTSAVDWLVSAMRNETRELGLELFETRVELQSALDRMVDRIASVQEKMDDVVGVTAAGGKSVKRKRVIQKRNVKWHTKAVEDLMQDDSEDEEENEERVKKVKVESGVVKNALWAAGSLVAGAVIGVVGVGLLC
ncbi:hypothetical protein HDU98_010208 [Podochytrium sp. JEL0797]|nr:hypothetical protein HDU98_010208 [Podochytrium sp. JEL0797]